MLVYGDRSETVDPRAYAEALAARCRPPPAARFDITRHAALVGLLIDMGKLAQGLADAAFEAEGMDDDAHVFAPIAAVQFAASVAISWHGGWGHPVEPTKTLDYLLEDELPQTITLREPEGYAFYAVYPELYAVAAETRADGQEGMSAVVAIRSIGTSLGAAAALSGSGYPPITVRPFGDPSARRVSLTPFATAKLERQAKHGVLVVDEGPGASGSSFGAVGDLLEEIGVPAERVTYMPSHLGDLGPQASERHRARWRTARKAHASFEDVILPRLPDWTEPLVGPAVAPLEDLSGGRWREGALWDAPAWPESERRKYRLTTAQGVFLLKFAGLGDIGETKLGRARALHVAGWGVEPLGLVHGFLVERFSSLSPVPADAGMTEVEGLAEYLAVRRSLAPPQPGASPDLLRTMMRRNLSLAGLPEAASRAERLPAPTGILPVAVDGRLHAWEWRRDPSGRLLKLDALDHCQAHDLVGAQDMAWDVAGAAVEFDLSPDAAERLREEVSRATHREIDPRSLDFHTLAYLAFQIGLWTFAAQGCEGARAAAEAERYKARADRWRPAA